MRKRGKPSAADLAASPITSGNARLTPPAHLSAKAAAIFRDVVASTPPGQFSLSDVYLLSTFAEVTALLENAARAAGRANKTEQPQKLKTLNDLAKTQVLLATKLRLSTQSRTRAETTARRHEAHKPSVYDVMKELEEWEHGRAT
jgi:hypothetical protein